MSVGREGEWENKKVGVDLCAPRKRLQFQPAATYTPGRFRRAQNTRADAGFRSTPHPYAFDAARSVWGVND